MKISVNDQEYFTITPMQRNVMAYNHDEDALDAKIMHDLEFILKHKYERCFERLYNEWFPKLVALGFTEIPSDPDEFAELVFAQPTYKDRKAREADAQL